MKRAGIGVLEVNSYFGPGEIEMMGAVGRETPGVRVARAAAMAANCQVGCLPSAF